MSVQIITPLDSSDSMMAQRVAPLDTTSAATVKMLVDMHVDEFEAIVSKVHLSGDPIFVTSVREADRLRMLHSLTLESRRNRRH